MKKVFQNQYFLAAAIIALGVGVYWYSTMNNKSWLLNELSNEGATDAELATYAGKTAAELRSILKAKKSSKQLAAS